jgi:hypothetical protein
MMDSTQTRNAIYRPRGGTLQDRYLALVRHVTRHGFTKRGRRNHSLTDMEAARWLSRSADDAGFRAPVERTSINTTRGSLMQRGLIVEAGRRHCYCTGNVCGVYAAAETSAPETPSLFD